MRKKNAYLRSWSGGSHPSFSLIGWVSPKFMSPELSRRCGARRHLRTIKKTHTDTFTSSFRPRSGQRFCVSLSFCPVDRPSRSFALPSYHVHLLRHISWIRVDAGGGISHRRQDLVGESSCSQPGTRACQGKSSLSVNKDTTDHLDSLPLAVHHIPVPNRMGRKQIYSSQSS